MSIKSIEFTDGTRIPVFSFGLLNDSTYLNAGEYLNFSFRNAYICAGNPSGNGFLPCGLIGKRLTDLDGNVWSFTQTGANTLTLNIARHDGTYFSYNMSSKYSTYSQLWYLVCTAVNNDNTYDIKLRYIYPTNRVQRGSNALRMGYIDGVNGQYTFAGDIASLDSSIEIAELRNVITGGLCLSVAGLRLVKTSASIDSASLVGEPYGSASTRPDLLIKLSSSGLVDYVDPPEETDPYENVGGDTPIPGGGAVGVPGFPGLTATSAGVIGLFAPSAAQMQLLADFMWTDFGGTGTTVEDILQEIVEALKRTISNPLDYIVGLNIIPSQGLSIGGSKSVRFGFVDSGVSMPILANQYFTVDCGSLAFDTVCGDTFLDYAPYSKFSIYLPYIGFKDVDPNDFVGHTIGVLYHGDCVTGGVTAYITKDGSVMYQYSGCCALNVPLSADSWGETISGAISVATGIVAAAASGGAAGVGLAAAKGAASVAANPSLLSPQVNHSGAVSGGAGCMGVQYPFVIREAVNFHSTAGFNKSSGYPAYYYKRLSEVTGFTTVIDAHISNITGATQSEIDEIERLLERGVIL